jgi:hypothetical protein
VHILAGELELGAVVRADTAGTHYQDLHRVSESSFDPGASSIGVQTTEVALVRSSNQWGPGATRAGVMGKPPM